MSRRQAYRRGARESPRDLSGHPRSTTRSKRSTTSSSTSVATLHDGARPTDRGGRRLCGRHMEILERLHADDPHLSAASDFKRNWAAPRDARGLVRAKGEIVVTMDGDLQNRTGRPAGLVAAIDAVSDGERAAARPRGSEGRTLRSRSSTACCAASLAVISDFGCAFNAYRRKRSCPCSGRLASRSSPRPRSSRAERRSPRSTSPTARARTPRATRRLG